MFESRTVYRVGIVIAALVSIAVPIVGIVSVYFDRSLHPQGTTIPFWLRFGASGGFTVGDSMISTFDGRKLIHRPARRSEDRLVVHSEDIETGETSKIQLELPNSSVQDKTAMITSWGNRTWATFGSPVQFAFELVDGKLIELERDSVPINPPISKSADIAWNDESRKVEINGRPAWIDDAAFPPQVNVFEEGKWKTVYEVDISDLKKFSVFDPSVKSASNYNVSCVSRMGKTHLFVNYEGYVFYREGIPLLPATPSPAGTMDASKTKEITILGGEAKSDWTLVRNKPFQIRKLGKWLSLQGMIGMLIDGKPTVLIIDEAKPGFAPGTLYQFDEGNWSEAGKVNLPFATLFVRPVITANGDITHLAVSTSLSRFKFRIEKNALRMKGSSQVSMLVHPTDRFPFYLRDLRQDQLDRITFLIIPPTIISQISFAVFFVLWTFLWTKNRYQFGQTDVRLGSIGLRGVSRSIDLAIVLAMDAYLATCLFQGFDWMTYDEARNIGAMHPVVTQLRLNLAMITAAYLVGAIVLAALQARWGITPGKWICGLRTVQTSLRPCGFARSLAREIVLAADICLGLWILPGLLSIGFSDLRQRFGDRVADTIVISVWTAQTSTSNPKEPSLEFQAT